MKGSPILFFALGLILIWCGLTGRLGVVLGAVFEPGRVSVNA